MILHPGAAAALRRLDLDELGIAREMAAGELASPQTYHNVSLYNMRITGTGVSYRPSLDEYVYRLPENYLTQEFLARCAGLPVVVKHPQKSLLNSEEFVDRVAGTVMLPYIKGDEVWAVCKIYDQEAINLMDGEQMSTSPAVLLGESNKLTLEDGTKLIVEGKPTLLDHLAIVSRGVWDKGGEASGIETNYRGDSAMAETETEKKAREDATAKADAAARADAEKVDMILKGIDSLRSDLADCNKRMDAWDDEKKKADAARKDAEDKEKEEKDKEEKKDAKKDGEDMVIDKSKKDGDDESDDDKAKRLVADKVKKDAEDKDKEEKKADAARADSLAATVATQAEKIKALEARIPAQPSDKDFTELVKHQARADDVFTAFGERAPRPLAGESPMMYRRRVASTLKKHSERWKAVDLDTLGEPAFEQIEPQVYADAAQRARTPNDIAKGVMRERTFTNGSGHVVTEFYGNTDTHFVKQFSRPPRRVRGVFVG